MKQKHRILLFILVIVTIIAFIFFNLFYKESMLFNAIQETNSSSPPQ